MLIYHLYRISQHVEFPYTPVTIHMAIKKHFNTTQNVHNSNFISCQNMLD